MAVRTVTGPMLGPNKQPLTDFKLTFTVTKRSDGTVQYTDDGHYPWHEFDVTTDANGDFTLDMVTGITYAVMFTGAIQDDGRVQTYPPGVGSSLEFVVPDGPGSISLQTIRALGSVDPDDPSVADIIANAINDYMANNGVADAIDTINTHVIDTDNPHGVTAGQVGLGNVANLAPADLPVSDATQSAMNLKFGHQVSIPTIANWWMHTGSHGGGAMAYGTSVAGALSLRNAVPIYIAQPMTLTDMAIHVTTPGTATAIRLGILRYDATENRAEREFDAGVVSATSAGLKTIPVSHNLDVGWYWLMASADGTVSTYSVTPSISMAHWTALNRAIGAMRFASGGIDPIPETYGSANPFHFQSVDGSHVLIKGIPS